MNHLRNTVLPQSYVHFEASSWMEEAPQRIQELPETYIMKYIY